MSAQPIAVLGDGSSHGGVLITSNQDGTVKLRGTAICVDLCLHSCPIPYHGTTPVTAITMVGHVQGKKIVTSGAVAGCGAIIIASNAGVNSA
jgi:uncharacterized Zn-binding protein involved in type VI secretion